MAQRTLFELTSGSSLATVSIIGSAGRKGDARKMTRALYWRMVAKAEQVIYETFKLEKDRVHLVSGGAAWAGMFLASFPGTSMFFDCGINSTCTNIAHYRPHCCNAVLAREGSCIDSARPCSLGDK